MRIDLASKRALVTGSTAGMGYAIAKGLAAAGAQVVVHGRSQETVTAARERLQREVPGSDVVGHPAPLEDPDAVRGLTDAVADVDVLVCNTGPTRSASVFEIDLAEWRRWLDTYLTAGMLLARHHVSRMMSRGYGRVLFGAGLTCSYTPADPGLDTMAAWLTCKAGLIGLSRSMAEVAAGSGVTVNAFVPGPAMTEDGYIRSAGPQATPFERFQREYFDGPGSSSLLHRFIDPAEIANLVVFLASGQAAAITGATLRVDGGIVRSIV